jgi:hypothetical protein
MRSNKLDNIQSNPLFLRLISQTRFTEILSQSNSLLEVICHEMTIDQRQSTNLKCGSQKIEAIDNVSYGTCYLSVET